MYKQPITRKFALPAERVWDAIRGLGRLDVWFPIIETCKIDGDGVGAVRSMTIVDGGGDIKDTIEEVDSDNWRLVYLRPESPFPVTFYRGTVEVYRSYDGHGVVSWTIDFESTPDDEDSVATLVRDAIGAGMAGMERDLLQQS